MKRAVNMPPVCFTAVQRISNYTLPQCLWQRGGQRISVTQPFTLLPTVQQRLPVKSRIGGGSKQLRMFLLLAHPFNTGIALPSFYQTEFKQQLTVLLKKRQIFVY